MANRLKVVKIQAIVVSRRQGWSKRRIARKLDVHHSTVAVHLAQDRTHQHTYKCSTGSGRFRSRRFASEWFYEAVHVRKCFNWNKMKRIDFIRLLAHRRQDRSCARSPNVQLH